jgi:hypothetical protein
MNAYNEYIERVESIEMKYKKKNKSKSDDCKNS